MRNRKLSALQIASWSAAGLLTGLAAGWALSEWAGGVNRPRLQRMATRIRERERVPRPALTAAAGARAVTAALRADAKLAEHALRASPVGPGAIELHGWVPNRATRAHAERVARSVPGIESVINRLLVRGEDDRAMPSDLRTSDQSA
ncbi:MAG TPA: BON domain-containing protein [Gemmatimonadales bacterium]|nr:BON domain-containing protein [Gemmatimonadales bacterium]